MSERATADLRRGWELFALSFTALFLELMMIRWAPSVVRLVAYYGNLLLISSFLGLGAGAMLASSRRSLMGLFSILLAADVALLLSCRNVVLPGSTSEVRFYGATSQELLNYGVLVALFVANALPFVPLGQRIGRLFQALPALRAYSWDLGGSLAGTLCFGLFSFTHFSPVLGLGGVVAVVWLLLPRRRARWVDLAIFATTVVAVAQANDPHALWSPYYYITVHEAAQSRLVDERATSVSAAPAELRTMRDPPAYTVHVNHDFYQPDLTLDPRRYTAGSSASQRVESLRNQYQVPYRLTAARDDVLVVGAGGGTDVEVALLNGAAHVDAVEIDPALVSISRKFNASGTYDDPRVTVYVDDARAFLRQGVRRYDVVVFGFLDSQTLFSYMSSLRLDGYIYTVQSVRSAYALLKDDGVIALSFVAGRPWLALKLVRTMAEATGTTPVVYRRGEQIVVCAFRGAHPSPPALIGEFALLQLGSEEWMKVEAPTDDWPYLYLARPTVPRDYAVVIGALASLSLASVLAIRGVRVGAGDGHFFLLGMGFLLLETKSITDCSLYFGTTWLVTTVVIAGVLLMVLAANVLAMRLRRSSAWLYAPLLAALLVLYLVPREAVLGLPAAQRVAWTLIVVPLPIFFAGLIFSTTFRNAGVGAADFLGANLIGAMVGGFSEYLGMSIGHDRLLLVVMGAYLASFLLRAGLRFPPAMPARRA